VKLSNNQQAFLELVRAGLWEKDAHLLPYGEIDFKEIYRLAQEQAVIGLVAAGFEHVHDVKVPKEKALLFVGDTLQLEQRNKAMNGFIGNLIENMRAKDIYPLLVKGQGIAQCYERPLWRATGDVDLYLSDSNYRKAKGFLSPLASSIEPEGKYGQHLGMTIGEWSVELHGNLRCGLSVRMDNSIDEVQKEVFCEGKVRSWMNENTQVFLPDANCDALLVFTHFIKHFFKEGVGMRQICDWCRLLWKYCDEINKRYLSDHLRKMGLMSEWKAFGSFAVIYLGMPTDAMPFYSSSNQWKRKAGRICSFILEVGNMGHNRDSSYFSNQPYLVRKVYSLGRRIGDLLRHLRIFPLDSLRFFPNILFNGLRSALRGE